VKYFILAAAFLLHAPEAHSVAFEAEQRWACITDQGAKAYLAIHGVEDDQVIFSWAVSGADGGEIYTLCKQRDALSESEIGEFCRLLGDEVSRGHARLHENCAD